MNLPSMNRKTIILAMALVVIVPLVFGIGYWLWWDQVARFQPHLIKSDQETFQSQLDRAGAASPNINGPSITIITHRACKSCRLYEETEAKELRSLGVNTRVIVIAPADDQGLSQSTAFERTTVAEIWWTRDFSLYQKWFETPDSQWKPDSIPSADNDLARTAVVNAGRLFVSEIGSVLRTNGVQMTYPLVIWRDKSNRLKVCTCTDKRSFAAIRQDLGIEPKNVFLEEYKSVEKATQKAAQEFDWKRLDPRTWFIKPKPQEKTEPLSRDENPSIGINPQLPTENQAKIEPVTTPKLGDSTAASSSSPEPAAPSDSLAAKDASAVKQSSVKQSSNELKSDPEWANFEAEPVYGPE